MKKEFDWNKFKTKNIAVHCKTQKETNMFFNKWMYLCDLFGLDYDTTERIVIDGVVKYFGLRKDEV